MSSGAGLNKWGNQGAVPLLVCQSTATAVASPLTAYGTIGVNDSGIFGCEAIGFTKWTFTMVGSGTGFTVKLYGTVDPNAKTQFWANGGPGAVGSFPASSWFLLPGPAEQAGTGVIGNPLTPSTPVLTVSMPLVAVRAVLTAVSTPSGSITVYGEAVP